VRYAAAPYRLLEPAPAGPSSATGGSTPRPEAAGKAVVQTGSFRDPDNARFLARDLEQKGFDARIVELQIGAQRFYRVVVGGDLAPADAEGLLLRLQEAGFAGVILQQD
jgi:cell division protein FtsN